MEDCKDCPKRTLGCHSWCKDYAERRKARDEQLAENAIIGSVASYFDNKKSKVLRKMQRKTKG